MKIGIDAKTLGKRRTGIGTYLEELIYYFNLIDSENEYILYSNREIDLPFELKSNFKIKYYNAKIGSFGVRYKLPKILKKDNIEVFWGPEHCLPKKSKNYKTVITIHDLAIFKFKKMGSFFNTIISKLYTKKCCIEANKIIAISNSTKKDIEEVFKIKSDKIEMIYNGESKYKYYKINRIVNQLFEDNISEKYQISDNYFLFVGTIEPRKNIVTLIKAYNQYRITTGKSHKLVIVGGIGWREQDTLNEIEKSPYKNDIIRTGYVSSLEKEIFYRNAMALVFPSIYEGFGFPILEAMSVGTPVITSNVSSMPEATGSLGYYIDNPMDFNALAIQMEKVCNDYINKKIDEEILANYSKKFSRKKCASETIDIFKTLKEEI